NSGKQQWKFKTGGKVRSSAAAGKGNIYIGSEDGTVYALDAKTGEKNGEQSIGGKITATPCVEIYNPHNDPNVFVGNTLGELHVLYIDKTRFMNPRASLQLGTPIHSAMSTAQSGLGGTAENVMFGADDGTVFSFAVPRGGEFKTGGKVRGSPAIDFSNGRFFVGSGDHKVYALTISDAKKQWEFETGGPVQSSPAFVNGTVYVGSSDGKVYALDGNKGKKMWEFKTGDAVFSSPGVVNGTVYVGSNDGYVYALSEK
ncbi:MAG: PQQ-binding-like beta-propeller repeat protein, partial [Halobacteria archaeon]|nr:PQQ-binding-like beta-propeller repeat protein [Halobacteria archaeon]